MKRHLSEEEEQIIGANIARILKLRKERGKQGYQTLAGWKTGRGLWRTLERMFDEVESGSNLDKF